MSSASAGNGSAIKARVKAEGLSNEAESSNHWRWTESWRSRIDQEDQMLKQMRQRSQDESGFTLIELLVVILIIGILAAIAIPAFLNQKGKANDAAAKVQVRTAQTAAETYATDHNGEYGAGMTVGELQTIEPTLKETGAAKLSIVGTPSSTEYEVVSKVEKGTTKNEFSIKRKSNGEVERTCTTAGTGACPTGGSW